MMNRAIRFSLSSPPWVLISIFGSLAALAACSSAGSPSYGADGGFETGVGGTLTNPGDDGLGAPNDDGAPGVGGSALPPEEEDPGDFRAPVVTGAFLWSANPESGRVALIDARDSSVHLLSAGLRPTHVFAVPSDPNAPKAMIQNVGSADASFIEFKDGQFAERRIETPSRINRWTISDSGDVAIAWSAPEEGVLLDPTEGLQEILVARLDDPEEPPVRLTVGYRPRQVIISQDEKRAVVISEDGFSVIDLVESIQVRRWISLGVGGGLDASVTADANFGLVRREGSKEIEIVSLTTDEDPFSLEMGAPVTDLDLGPDGLVIALARELGEVLTFSMRYFDIDQLKPRRTTISGITVGSAVITDGGERAVLYTTAIAEERVAILELTPGDHFLDYRTVSTKLAVRAVSTSPNGRYAVVLADGAPEGKGGFSMVSLDQERFPRIVGTSAPVEAVALTDTGVLVTAATSSVFEAQVGQLPGLTVEAFALASRPLSTGVIGELNLGYVAQSHPEGRVTFFSLNGDEVRTVSGYELSAEVIDE
jgi:hypothetical protein